MNIIISQKDERTIREEHCGAKGAERRRSVRHVPRTHLVELEVRRDDEEEDLLGNSYKRHDAHVVRIQDLCHALHCCDTSPVLLFVSQQL